MNKNTDNKKQVTVSEAIRLAKSRNGELCCAQIGGYLLVEDKNSVLVVQNPDLNNLGGVIRIRDSRFWERLLDNVDAMGGGSHMYADRFAAECVFSVTSDGIVTINKVGWFRIRRRDSVHEVPG